jgi:hypothetical protein
VVVDAVVGDVRAGECGDDGWRNKRLVQGEVGRFALGFELRDVLLSFRRFIVV